MYMIRAFGMSLLMMTIMTAGLNQLPREMNAHGTAMSNTVRQIAGSIGISLMTTIFSNRTTFHIGKLSEGANLIDPSFSQTFASYVQSLASATGLPLSRAKQMLEMILYEQANQQAAVMGINDAFFWSMVIALVGMILSFFLRDVRRDKPSMTKPLLLPPGDSPPAKEEVVGS
jgi:DHA2 family multidrug resistance protein